MEERIGPILQHDPALPERQRTADQLRRILAQPQYHKTQQQQTRPSILDRLARWLGNLLQRIIPNGAPSTAAAWVLVGIVLVLVIYLITRIVWTVMTSRERGLARSSVVDEASLGYDELCALALAASRRGDYREAIRLRFRALVTRLDTPTSAVQTNYQLMRAAIRSHPGAAVSLPPLVTLFEDVWYGGAAAGAMDFERADQLASGVEANLEPPEQEQQR